MPSLGLHEIVLLLILIGVPAAFLVDFISLIRFIVKKLLNRKGE